MEPRTASIAIHLDSLTAAAHLLAPGERAPIARDPSYDIVDGPFMELAAEMGFRYTVFVLGRDVADRRVAAMVRAWHEAGHEIANHSFDHLPHLGDDDAAIEEQVRSAHVAIADAIGEEPVGFVSPSWSMSGGLLAVLGSLGYAYDASLFPSPLMLLVQLRLRWRSHPRSRPALPFPRRDLRGSLVGSRQPYLADARSPWAPVPPSRTAVLEMPLPTNRLRLPVWHTMRFVLPRQLFLWTLDDAMRACRGFHYVMHPIDLLDPERHLTHLPRDFGRIERVGVPIDVKRQAVRDSLRRIVERRAIVTMRELAASLRVSALGAGP